MTATDRRWRNSGGHYCRLIDVEEACGGGRPPPTQPLYASSTSLLRMSQRIGLCGGGSVVWGLFERELNEGSSTKG